MQDQFFIDYNNTYLQMQDTENYLNAILQKRAHAVPNPYATRSRNTKQPDNITRIPIIQQKDEDMPTVFRKKVETVFKNDPSEAKSRYTANPSQYNVANSSYNQRETSLQRKQAESKGNQSERVEYLLITKRIANKDQEEDEGVKVVQKEDVQEGQPEQITLVEKKAQTIHLVQKEPQIIKVPILKPSEFYPQPKTTTLAVPQQTAQTQPRSKSRRRRKIFQKYE